MLSIRIPKFRAEHYFGVFLVLFWGKDILFSYVKAVFMRIPYIKYSADYIFPALMGVCLLLSIAYIYRSVSWKDILFTGVTTLVYFLQMLLYSDNGEYLMSIAASFFTTVFPLYFIGLCFRAERHLKLLYGMSIINIWAFIAYTLFSGEMSVTDQAVYSGFMHRAYVLLPQVLVAFAGAFKKPNVLNIVTVVVASAFLLMCGNRGSILILMVFIAVYILFVSEKKRHWSFYAILLAVFALIAHFFVWFVSLLQIVFLKFGMSTRVIERLMEGEFFVSHGRDVISKELWGAILENPILGNGLASDHVVTGSYAHNLAIELWMSFGLIMGSVVLAVIVYLIVKAWLSAKTISDKTFLLIMICVGFLKLFISNSFLLEGMFFMLLGACVAQIRQSKRNRMIDKSGVFHESL